MKSIFLFLVLFSCFSCTGKDNINPSSEIILPTDSFSKPDPISLDTLWQSLVFEKGGCLTGGQRVRDGKFGGEGCVLTSTRSASRADWRPFFFHPKEELTEFLITKFADTSKTRIHTCPFFLATNGEIAVYCLSKIHLVNWYDFEPFLEYRDREVTDSMDSEQIWLQAILEDPKQREALIEEWLKL